MYRIEFTNEMKRNVKLMRKRGKDISKLTDILDRLASGQQLPQKNNDHQLTGDLKDFRNVTSNLIGCLFISCMMIYLY